MVKLNEDAFAAVNAAFPDVSKETTGTTTTTATSSISGTKSVSYKADQRKGVGASRQVNEIGSAGIHERVLNIGNKKRKKLSDNSNDDDDEEDDVKDEGFPHQRKQNLASNDDQDDDEEDEEEDMGRTAIATSSKRIQPPPPVEHLASSSNKKKKHKKGKKERQNLKESTEASTVDQGPPQPTKRDVLCGKIDSRTLAESIAADATAGPVTSDATLSDNAKKRKRTKVRSRQKNIRKDTRASKPAHLIPGSEEYRGRPLTAETRRRLNMPESRRDAKLKSYWSEQTEKAS